MPALAPRRTGRALLVAALATPGCSLLLSPDGIVGLGAASSSAAADAASSSPCAVHDPTLALCDTFDAPVRAPFWKEPFVAHGAIVPAHEGAFSAPASLLAQASSSTDGMRSFAYYEATFPSFATTPAHATLAFAIALRKSTLSADVVLASLGARRGKDSSELRIVLARGPSGPVLGVSESRVWDSIPLATMHTSTAALAEGEWVRAKLDTRSEAGGPASRHVTLTLDDVPVVDEGLKQEFLGGVPFISIGALDVPADDGEIEVSYDDTTVRFSAD